ncbi:TetR/AcrR family transcriptional regulator [Frigoribacterium faeni]|uniref:TetR/AcrR family transcriptional regulator n=1 Tax=Frigoribacterium faeni TaxID=145483 RepID=UPI00141A7FC0|nr:TetR/AcrR family transcriptional regulator [Frigoribacterium faeni]
MSGEPVTPAGRPSGRPRRSSADVLADAAAELFLEQGWARTTVDQIAQRAGVSRGTFFNYFESKADALWLDLDASAAGLGDALRASSGSSPVRRVEAALVGLARRHPADRVPWALSQSDAMGLGDDLVSSAAVRLVRIRATVTSFLGEAGGLPRGDVRAEVAASALLAAAATAVVVWARAGVGRRPLDEEVAAALAPVADGLDAQAARG